MKSIDIVLAPQRAKPPTIATRTQSASVYSDTTYIHPTDSMAAKTSTPTSSHPEIKATSTHAHGFSFRDMDYQPHNNLELGDVALVQFVRAQKILLAAVALIFLLGLLINWRLTLTLSLSIMTILYFGDLLFNLFLITRALKQKPEISVTDDQLATLKDSDLPVYTILCPLYKESQILPQFTAAMQALDYDKSKLQVLLLLEENDQETIDVAHAMNLPDYIEIIVVPHSMPKTKPKACNYGLKVARGEFVVIYDAEDIPDPKQVKRAVYAFSVLPKNIACIQSKLNFYNPTQNVLTRAFTAEYSLWFDLILPGMQYMNVPIPLGGTSNHFRTDLLRQVGSWDAFNVTEDADLGMRLVKNGYRTYMLDSTTEEEANSDFKNWFWQRSRWIKGYIQTYFVHTRNLRRFSAHDNKPWTALFFGQAIGGKVISMLVNPIMWAATILYFVFRSQIGTQVDALFPTPILYMGVTCLVFGNFLYMYYYAVGCLIRGRYDLVRYTIFVPVYWLMMSAAAYYALIEFIYKPHHWRKTKHGLHLAHSAQKGSAT